jgi:hypothetical protein
MNLASQLFLALFLQEEEWLLWGNMHLTRSLASIILALITAAAPWAASRTPHASAFTLSNVPDTTVHSVGPHQGPTCSLSPPPRIPFCGSTGNTLTATVSGGALPNTFSWTLAGDGKLTGGQGTQTITFDIGPGGVTLFFTVSDAVGGTALCSATVICTPPPPPPAFCTLTQGSYGNAGGAFNGTRTLVLTQSLLSTDLVVGMPGRSLRIQLPAAECIIQRLPANGTPRELPATLGDATLDSATCQTFPTSLPVTSTGKFHNVLLGQTITLSLNTRLSAGLGSLAICNIMTTQAALPGPDGLFGTSDDVRNPGPDGALGTSDDPIITVNIPLSVTTALSALGLPRTVSGLLELANRGLAGEATGGASLGDVNAAVNAINVGFSGCRFLLRCSDF